MEQTTRQRGERTPAEQEREMPKADATREGKLEEIDDLLDELEEVLEENDAVADEARAQELRAHRTLNDDSVDARLARLGLFGPGDLDEAIARELAEQLAEAAELEQQEMLEWFHGTNPPCVICGRCPVNPGCPFQADDGTRGIYSWDQSVEIF